MLDSLNYAPRIKIVLNKYRIGPMKKKNKENDVWTAVFYIWFDFVLIFVIS